MAYYYGAFVANDTDKKQPTISPLLPSLGLNSDHYGERRVSSSLLKLILNLSLTCFGINFSDGLSLSLLNFGLRCQSYLR